MNVFFYSVEHSTGLYASTMALIEQLSLSHVYDLRAMDEQVDRLHERWSSFKVEVMNETTRLHRKIIDNLPSRQACEQMSQFIDKIKRILDDDHRTTIDTRATLQHLLQRYQVSLEREESDCLDLVSSRICEWR
jgi:hypothetical protein